MQRALLHLYQWQLLEKLILIAIFSAGLALALPTRTGNFDFRHFDADDGMTISFSTGAPPMAAIEDEHLPVVIPSVTKQTEVAVQKVTAPLTIHPVKRAYQNRFAQAKPQAGRRSKFTGPYAKQLAQLKNFVQAIPAHRSYARRYTNQYNGDFGKNSGRTNSFNQVAAGNGQSNQKTQSVRDRVEAPLIAPSVQRGLPRGEEDPPTIIEKDKMGARTPSFEVTIPNQNPDRVYDAENLIPQDPSHALLTSVKANANSGIAVGAQNRGPGGVSLPRGVITSKTQGPNFGAGRGVAGSMSIQSANGQSMVISNKQNFAGRESLASVAKRMVAQNRSAADLMGQRSSPQTTEIMALDGGNSGTTAHQIQPPAQSQAQQSSSEPTAQDIYRISGQVQLTGGLAMASSNELTIQWRTGNQIRDAKIDYSSGYFLLNVPTLTGGKIIGVLKDETGHTLGRGETDLSDVELEAGQNQIADLQLTIDAQQSLVRGQIISAYSVGQLVIPVKGAEIYGPASSRDVADNKGTYRLSQINGDSTMVLDTFAPEHWGTRVIAAGSTRPKIPLFSDKMLQSFLEIIDQNKETADFGIVWGEVNRKGQPVAGVKVGISTTDAIGPFYFNELRIPDKNLTTTTSNGLYAFVKVKPGLHVVTAEYNKAELPSSVASVSASMVSYTKILFKSLTIAGHVVDPLAQIGVRAQVSVVGSSMTTTATPQGFQFKVPSSDPLVFVEASAGANYLISRVAIPRKEAQNVNLFMYRRDWISNQLRKVDLKYDSTKGLIVGAIEGPLYRVRIDDMDIQSKQAVHDAESNPIYFNAAGDPDSNMDEGLANGGGFMIPNLNPGIHTLVITSADGEMTSSRMFVSEGGVVNVLTMPLRP